VWWNQNNTPAWRIYLTLLYSIVVDGLGNIVTDTAVFTQMRNSEFKSSTKINSEFVV
jgi:hypothetical protein